MLVVIDSCVLVCGVLLWYSLVIPTDFLIRKSNTLYRYSIWLNQIMTPIIHNHAYAQGLSPVSIFIVARHRKAICTSFSWRVDCGPSLHACLAMGNVVNYYTEQYLVTSQLSSCEQFGININHNMLISSMIWVNIGICKYSSIILF